MEKRYSIGNRQRIIIAFVLIFTLCSAFSQMTKRYEHLVFQDADIRAIFQYLAKEAGVNIIVNPGIDQSITLDLRNISLQRVIDILLETYDLTMLRENNYYRIIATADYRKKQREQMNYENEKKALLDLETRIFQVKYATANELEAAIAQALSPRGQSVVDSRSNAIIVTDIPEQFEKIDKLLADLDSPTKQVKVSAKILLIDQNFMRKLGVAWNANTTARVEDRATAGETVTMYSATDGVADKLGHFSWGIITGNYAIEATLSAILHIFVKFTFLLQFSD